MLCAIRGFLKNLGALFFWILAWLPGGSYFWGYRQVCRHLISMACRAGNAWRARQAEEEGFRALSQRPHFLRYHPASISSFCLPNTPRTLWHRFAHFCAALPEFLDCGVQNIHTISYRGHSILSIRRPIAAFVDSTTFLGTKVNNPAIEHPKTALPASQIKRCTLIKGAE